MVGKIIVVWLLLVSVLGLAAVDTASIVFARFRASDTATNAAADAANSWRDHHDRTAACDAAAASVMQDNLEAHIPKGGCILNVQSGEVTITVRLVAKTVLVGRLSFLRQYGNVSATETTGPTLL